MKRLLIVGIAALAVSCGGATESHNSSQAGATARAGQANPAGQPTVTITGCLENMDRPEGEPVGTAGGGSKKNAPDQKNAGAGAIGERYTLTHAASESPASNPAASSYILDGNVSDLRAHVEQQVRVQGELDAAAANTAGPQRIRVSSVEMVADTCTKR